MITVRGKEYNNIEHWLYNEACRLVHEFIESAKPYDNVRIKDLPPEIHDKLDEVRRFKEYTEKYLGYKWDDLEHYFVDIRK